MKNTKNQRIILPFLAAGLIALASPSYAQTNVGGNVANPAGDVREEIHKNITELAGYVKNDYHWKKHKITKNREEYTLLREGEFFVVLPMNRDKPEGIGYVGTLGETNKTPMRTLFYDNLSNGAGIGLEHDAYREGIGTNLNLTSHESITAEDAERHTFTEAGILEKLTKELEPTKDTRNVFQKLGYWFENRVLRRDCRSLY
jgi:hypothetical protein